MQEKFEIEIIKELFGIVHSLYNRNCENFNNCGRHNCTEIVCQNSSLECYLIKNKIHEQSIAYKIAYNLEKYLTHRDTTNQDNLSLDVEYNKAFKRQEQTNDLKRSNCSEKFDKCKDCILKSTVCNGKNYFRPDIIIHSRGTDNNILIIECKKAQTTNGKKVKNDFNKIKAFTCEKGNFKYKIGVSIVFNKTHPIFTCFTSNDTIASELKALCFENFTINPTIG